MIVRNSIHRRVTAAPFFLAVPLVCAWGCSDDGGYREAVEPSSGGTPSAGGYSSGGSSSGGSSSGGSSSGGSTSGGAEAGGSTSGGSESGGSTSGGSESGGSSSGGSSSGGAPPDFPDSIVEEFEGSDYDAIREHVRFLITAATYDRSSDSLSRPYDEWSESAGTIPNKVDFRIALDEAWQWLHSPERLTDFEGQPHTAMTEDGEADETGRESTSPPRYALPLEDGWQIYIEWVAHSIALDRSGELPWTLHDLLAQDEALVRNLLNAAEMMSRRNFAGHEIYFQNTYHGNYLGLTFADYLGGTIPGRPRYTYSFLLESGLIGATRLSSIEALLDWSKRLAHYYGANTRAVAEEHWGHPYPPTVEHIIEGTIRETETDPRHWTLGCHGTVRFLKSVLRSINIPVQIPALCGHAIASFPSEGLFMDHGDNPYNSAFKDSQCGVSHLLIDEEVFFERFVYETNHNESDVCDATPGPVGRQANDEELLLMCQ